MFIPGGTAERPGWNLSGHTEGALIGGSFLSVPEGFTVTPPAECPPKAPSPLAKPRPRDEAEVEATSPRLREAARGTHPRGGTQPLTYFAPLPSSRLTPSEAEEECGSPLTLWQTRVLSGE